MEGENRIVGVEYPMKWHKFLIYFSLWASALLNIGMAINYGTGMSYGDYAGQVYAMFPALNVLDKVMAVGILALCVLTIAARFALAKYKANGPKLLISVYAVNFLLTTVYVIAFAAILEVGIFEAIAESSYVSAMATSLVMLFVNKTYYAKRAELFIN